MKDKLRGKFWQRKILADFKAIATEVSGLQKLRHSAFLPPLSSKLYTPVEPTAEYASTISDYVPEREQHFEQYGVDSKWEKEIGSAT
jgi:hypothetical protein